MRALIIGGLCIAVGVGGIYLATHQPSPAHAGEFVSGPQEGAKIPGAFEPLNINGPDAGDEACLYCKFGNSPTVMVFATKPSDGLAAFIRKLDQSATESAKNGEVGACVVITDTSAPMRKELAKLADKENLKTVILGVIAAKDLKAYQLHTDAEVTVLLYTNRVVRVNRAFNAGEFTDKMATELAAEVTRLYAGK